MSNTQQLIARLYRSFNARDIEACLAEMTDDVQWPKASEGGRIIGKDEIRDYWQRQWAEFDPHVEPVEIQESGNVVVVTVHQVVKDRSGILLSDQHVTQTFTMVHGRVSRMDLHGEKAPAF